MQRSDVNATDLLESRLADRSPLPAPVIPAPSPLMRDDMPLTDALAVRCRQALDACGAQSAGISMFSPGGLDTLTWLAAVGHLAPFAQAVFPRDDSPCGICFEYRAPQLFISPHLYFAWMRKVGIQATELLVYPIQGPFGAFFGTIWVMTHGESTVQFDASHARVLEKLSNGLWSRLSDVGTTARLSGF